MSQPAFDFGDDDLDDGANPTYTVGELAEAINSSFQRSFGDGIWVRGEITGWSDRGNHAYFSLADDSRRRAQRRRHQRPVLRAGPHAAATDAAEASAAPRRRHEGARVRLPRLLRAHRSRRPEDDRHRPEVHARRHRPVARRGRASPGRRRVCSTRTGRRPLSPVPLRIGVVTSVGTAAWHDFRHELESSGLGFQLSVVDVRVQGEFAVRRWSPPRIGTLAPRSRPRRDRRHPGRRREERTRRVRRRGDRPHDRRAARCRCSPGSGHEVDRSVADEVAHTALKTPTACAGALIDRVAAYRAATEDGVVGDPCDEPASTLATSTNELSDHGPSHRPPHPCRGRTRRRTAGDARRPPRAGRPGRARQRHTAPRHRLHGLARALANGARARVRSSRRASPPGSPPSTPPSSSPEAGRSPVAATAPSSARSTTWRSATSSPPLVIDGSIRSTVRTKSPDRRRPSPRIDPCRTTPHRQPLSPATPPRSRELDSILPRARGHRRRRRPSRRAGRAGGRVDPALPHEDLDRAAPHRAGHRRPRRRRGRRRRPTRPRRDGRVSAGRQYPAVTMPRTPPPTLRRHRGPGRHQARRPARHRARALGRARRRPGAPDRRDRPPRARPAASGSDRRSATGATSAPAAATTTRSTSMPVPHSS